MFINILLENGRDSSGNMRYVLLPLPDINLASFDNAKLVNIVNCMASCLNKSIGLIHKVEGSTITVISR